MSLRKICRIWGKSAQSQQKDQMEDTLVYSKHILDIANSATSVTGFKEIPLIGISLSLT